MQVGRLALVEGAPLASAPGCTAAELANEVRPLSSLNKKEKKVRNIAGKGFTQEELEAQDATELPSRDLLIGVSLLGIPLAGVDGVTVNIDTSGPNWLFGSIGSL